jgi:hypothetical protein
MGSVSPQAAALAREVFDAVEPMLLRLRQEQQEFHRSLERLVNAIVDARVATKLAEIARPYQPPTTFAVDRIYPAGRLATYRGGLWQALDDTGQEPGTGADWRLLANGIADISGFLDEDDPRLMTFAVNMSSGDTVNLAASLPIPVHRGPWQAEATYQPADEVFHNGSSWRARRETKSAPPGDDWLLVASRGERGKK